VHEVIVTDGRSHEPGPTPTGRIFRAILAENLTSASRPKLLVLAKLGCLMLKSPAPWQGTQMRKKGPSFTSRLLSKLRFMQQSVTGSSQPLVTEPTGWPEYREGMRTNLRLSAEQLRKGALRAGSKKYIWRTSGDGNVCPECAKNEGKLFAWDEPPIGGHPGETACCSSEWCRCFAEPIV
jgi:hypothetical protein